MKLRDLKEAIEMYMEEHPDRKNLITKQHPSGIYTEWGCQFFDNEKEAREGFG